jgi:hypothetical protein
MTYSGSCCTITSFFCEFPACLGIYSKSSYLCLQSEQLCRPMCCEEKEKKNLLCILCKSNDLIVMPTTICKSVSTVFCCDSRAAFPWDEDVPCVYTYLPFCICCYNFQCALGCCKTINELNR